MPIMKNVKAIIGFIILLIVLASSGYGLYQKLRAERLEVQKDAAVQEAKTATRTLDATRAAVDSRDTELRARSGEQQAATEALEAAIEANPDWGSTRTPDAVASSLCEFIPCEDAPGVPAE